MTRKQKHLLTRILVAAVLFLAGSLLHLPEYVEMGVFLVCYAVVGWDIVWKAITNILHGQVFDENFLMTIATIGALILQLKDLPEPGVPSTTPLGHLSVLRSARIIRFVVAFNP